MVAGEFEVPWGLAALPNGPVLLAERNSGRITLVDPAGGRTPVGTVDGVVHEGESGLLGLAANPSGRTVFAYLTTDSDNRVVSFPFDGRRLGSPTVVLRGIPRASFHDGGRMTVGPDGRLWIGTGDAGVTWRSQDKKNLGGKILRIGLDGSIPADNPFPGSPVWSYGHRNVQGLAFDSTGQLWATEFGQQTWDELNRVERGGNHGWPMVEGIAKRAALVDPQVAWRPDEASPSGLAIVDDVAYMAALRGARLWQIPLVDGRAGQPVARLTGEFGRLRTVLARPDGTLWVTTSNRDGRGRPGPDDDRVLELRLG